MRHRDRGRETGTEDALCLFKRLVLGYSSVLRDFFSPARHEGSTHRKIRHPRRIGRRGHFDRRSRTRLNYSASSGDERLLLWSTSFCCTGLPYLRWSDVVRSPAIPGDRSEGQSSRDPLPLRGPPTNCHGSAAARCTVQGMHRLRKGGKRERETKVKGGGKRHLRARALKRKKTGSRKKKNHARELGLNKEKKRFNIFPPRAHSLPQFNLPPKSSPSHFRGANICESVRRRGVQVAGMGRTTTRQRGRMS